MVIEKMGKYVLSLALLSLFSSVGSGQSLDQEVDPASNRAPSLVQAACMKSTEVTVKDLPEKIYASAAQCARDGDYPDAAKLMFVSGIFWRFDALRVPDESSHDVGQIFLLAYIGNLPEEQRAPLASEMKTFQRGSKVLSTFCKQMREMGPPTYYPSYMIEHGMGAFTGGDKDGLVANFDSGKAWEKVLVDDGHCEPVAAARMSK